ncbi:MAG: hypothetical protein LUF00_11405 [Lachnospiraceae bacterium]|nr:hypothetical protein [Lachnospiraceae bacterium]
MADRELRRMNRTELIEIIYALQQNERSLRAENEELRRQLDDKLLRIEKAGSIAEAALSLNHIFEDAEAAAQQYLLSLQNVSEAEAQTLAEAQRRADELIANAQAQEEQAARQLRQTEEECQAMKEKAEQDIIRQRTEFFQWGQRILRENPELAARMRKEARMNRNGGAQAQTS